MRFNGADGHVEADIDPHGAGLQTVSATRQQRRGVWRFGLHADDTHDQGSLTLSPPCIDPSAPSTPRMLCPL